MNSYVLTIKDRLCLNIDWMFNLSMILFSLCLSFTDRFKPYNSWHSPRFRRKSTLTSKGSLVNSEFWRYWSYNYIWINTNIKSVSTLFFHLLLELSRLTISPFIQSNETLRTRMNLAECLSYLFAASHYFKLHLQVMNDDKVWSLLTEDISILEKKFFRNIYHVIARWIK